MIGLRRTGGMRRPPFNETLEIADNGLATMWRSVGWASDPSTPVGRFAGRLSAERWKDVLAAAADVAAVGPSQSTVRPDSPVDRLRVDAVEATLGMYDHGDGPWGALASALRGLLSELGASPVAAVGLDMSGGVAHLVHLGTDHARVDLSGLAVEAQQWRGSDGIGLWRSQAAGDVHVDVDAGPGWRYELPLDVEIRLEPGDRLSVKATFALHDGDRWVGVGLYVDGR